MRITLVLFGLALLTAATLMGQEGPAPPVSPANTPAYLNELRELAKLYDEGVLTKEEFESKKRSLLSVAPSISSPPATTPERHLDIEKTKETCRKVGPEKSCDSLPDAIEVRKVTFKDHKYRCQGVLRIFEWGIEGEGTKPRCMTFSKKWNEMDSLCFEITVNSILYIAGGGKNIAVELPQKNFAYFLQGTLSTIGVPMAEECGDPQ